MSGAALFNLAQTALTSDAGNISSSSSRDGLARAASMPLQRQRNGAAAKPPLEWRRFLTVEERTGVRSKLRAAYADQCKTYEELLDTVTAIEEELLHMAAPSRLDYFKAGVQFDRRVADKRKQLAAPAAGEGAAEAPRKRARPEDSSPPQVSQDWEATQET
ncbi:unnamed protein product [Pelagomonas calceolata]|jgi:hypothetical protein|uniref:Uncharacterized protein n=1 Tax=Pelagomonas calceolata TaxID=35677 RepID=A0A8J2SPE0_9STRA|nr:unnamed protein product [Pelagomonas calceolata]|mmetsp:Transcript_1915/g.5375  ORF Transcript_1915/g.5375 Transcript_1915/m.5375 type:complete len:161 (-) Transcript_1915:30-512(-)